jgi:monoamine oxidase
MSETNNWYGEVLIIGAGAAGLSAAHLLHNQEISFMLLEASNRAGGRIWSIDDGFASFPLEMGAEEIHGSQSIWYECVRRAGKHLLRPSGWDYFYLNGRLDSERQWYQDQDLQWLDVFFAELYDYEGAEINLMHYIREQEVPPHLLPLLEAWVGNEYGTSNERIGLRSLIEADRAWLSGNGNYVLQEASCMSVIDKVFAEVMPKIKYGHAVKHIDYSGEFVRVTDQNGNLFFADKLIITVPLTVLQRNDIVFHPPLPETTQTAIHSLRMDAGLKVILKFSEAFWPANMQSLYGGTFVPEYWVTNLGRSQGEYLLTAFVNGKPAERLSEMPQADALALILQELGTLLGRANPKDLLLDYRWADWKKEPFIGGAYSYPSPNATQYRQALAQPINKTLYFAGEATHTGGHFATVHGAMETAYVAVERLLKDVGMLP